MTFSAIVPVYNAQRYLPQCLDSILNQGGMELELILVNDGSTDASPRICEEYAARDPRIKVLHKENGGQVSARKAGIFAASGDYICYVDADDSVTSDWLQTIADCIGGGKYPDIVVYGAEEILPEGKRQLPCYLEEGYYNKKKLQEEVYPYVICDRRFSYTTQLIFPVAWNKAYRRELLQKHYCRDERIARGEDTAFVYECLLGADDIYVCKKVLYTYNRMNNTSISALYGYRLTMNDIYLADYLRSRLKQYGEPVERQINDFIVSKIIRSVLWKAKNGASAGENARQLRLELSGTRILKRVHLKGLPIPVALFVIALKLRLYVPIMLLAGLKNGLR